MLLTVLPLVLLSIFRPTLMVYLVLSLGISATIAWRARFFKNFTQRLNSSLVAINMLYAHVNKIHTQDTCSKCSAFELVTFFFCILSIVLSAFVIFILFVAVLT